MFETLTNFLSKIWSRISRKKEPEPQNLSVPLPLPIIPPSPQVLSFIRYFRHKHNPHKKFGGLNLKGEPQHNTNVKLPYTLLREENTKIRTVFLKLCGDENGPYVISPVIDHWTTAQNLKKIINSGAFYGNAFLKQHRVVFNENCLAASDLLNLDGNVICFCPGGFVDSKALEGEDRIRLRVDLRKAKLKGKFNTFFKITDLCFNCYSVNVQLTKELSAYFCGGTGSCFSVKLKFKETEIKINFSKNELIFYGNLVTINRFCLLMFFIALEKAKKQGFENSVLDIYNYLNTKDEKELRKLLICFAQNMTMYAEFNFNCMLSLTPNLIYDIHSAKENTTYSLHDFPPDVYANILKDISNGMSFDNAFRDLNKNPEVIKSIIGNGDITLYGIPLFSDHSVDAREISAELFSEGKGYVETRAGTREVPALSYHDRIDEPNLTLPRVVI